MGDNQEIPLKMAVSVPKRLFKRAVDRNLLKRRIREAYRLQKPGFLDYINTIGVSIQLVIQFRGRKIEDFHLVAKKLEEALDKMKKKLSRDLANNGPSTQAL